MGKAAKAVAILAIIFMMYMNVQLIQFYAESAEYAIGVIFGPLFGEQPISPQMLMMINFGAGLVGIIGTAVS